MTDKLPAKLIAGDTWSWSRSFGDYPAPTWTAAVYFENAAGTFNQASIASGSDHAFTIDAATTTGKKAGRYKYSIRVSSGGQAYTVESGWVEVIADPAAAGTHDPRGNSRRMLDAIEATLLGRATSDQLAMTLNGRSISRIPLPELSQFRDKLRQEVRTEENTASAGLGRDLKTRFTRP